MILTGTEDLRIIKTIQAIKGAFGELIAQKDYEKITVKELCDLAQINKKTFYHYYETLDALLAEMQGELAQGYLDRVKKYKLPEELAEVNREFFLYSVEQGPAYEKITCSGSYQSIRDTMIDRVTSEGWGNSKRFRQLPDYEKALLMTFINNAVLGAYRQWVQSGKEKPLEEVVDLTNSLVLGGVKGFFK